MFRGSLVALVTPMHENGSVDWASLENLIDWHVDQGSKGLVAVGTTGESATFDIVEHLDVVRFVVKHSANRIPVMAGTGANSTSEALELTVGAKDAGVDGCLLVTPYYNKPTQEGLYLHHKFIADRVDIAQYLYNVPGRTAVDMLPETVARISELKNVAGIKEATGDMERLKHIKSLVSEDFVLLSGDDATTREFIELGGHGGISVTANVAPAIMSAMCEAALNADQNKARELDDRLQALDHVLFLESNPIPVKWALEQMQKIGPGIRLPMTNLAEKFQPEVRKAMVEAGLLND